MRARLWLPFLLTVPAGCTAQEYEILAVQYGAAEEFPLRSLLPDASEGESVDVAFAFWAIHNQDRLVLFDAGFFRERWLENFDVDGFVRPDQALLRAGLDPEMVTDIVVSHAHWDHMGGVELFPGARVWIQADEYTYYTGAAWQPGGNHGGIDADDVAHLVERHTAGLVRLIDGDGTEILPGITVFTGARHTYASQYVLVDGVRPFILASDNAYLFRNLSEGRAGATFAPEDREANLAALRRMVELAGAPERVIPGHDLEVFRRFPNVAEGVVRIRP